MPKYGGRESIKEHMYVEMTTNNFRLMISSDLRKAMRSLIASFQADLWDDISSNEEFNTKFPVLVKAIYSNIDGRGTNDTLNIMRDACTPTDWLVIGLTSCQASATDTTLIKFIQTVFDKLNTIYTLLCSVDMHYRWEGIRNACISSLLTQLKSVAF
jgi:hypothetical protein